MPKTTTTAASHRIPDRRPPFSSAVSEVRAVLGLPCAGITVPSHILQFCADSAGPCIGETKRFYYETLRGVWGVGVHDGRVLREGMVMRVGKRLPAAVRG